MGELTGYRRPLIALLIATFFRGDREFVDYRNDVLRASRHPFSTLQGGTIRDLAAKMHDTLSYADLHPVGLDGIVLEIRLENLAPDQRIPDLRFLDARRPRGR